MFLDWLKLDGLTLVSWYLLTLLAALAVYPLVYRLMGSLPSRGYPLARAAGLMLTAFIYWILNTLGPLQNTLGSILFAWLIVVGLSVVSYFSWQDREPILPWLRKNTGLILATEGLFVVMFVGWAAVRALNHEIFTTEKPMEMMMLSSTMRSASLPPHDGWMAGYDISYYYFGYVILAMLAKISAVDNGVAFTLAIPLLFALVGTGVMGIAYDLIMAHLISRNQVKPSSAFTARGFGLLATVFVVLIGNLGPVLLEMPYQTDNASTAYMNFWDMRFRQADSPSCPPTGSLDPTQWGGGCYWWWFAYSRVVQDRDLNGSPIEIIDEMPQMSFIIFDDHPHVLALPFAVLAIGLGLALVLRKRALSGWEYLLYGIFVGGMAFLNSWDAVYIVFIIGAEGLRRLISNGTGRFTRQDWFGIAWFAVIMLGLTGILYSPFFISFRSQAGGILPNVEWPTRFQQFFMFYGIFLIILVVFLFVEYRRAGGVIAFIPIQRIRKLLDLPEPRWMAEATFNVELAWQALGSIAAVLVIIFTGIAIAAALRPDFQNTISAAINGQGGLGQALGEIILRRFTWGILPEGLLVIMIVVVIGRLFAHAPQTAEGAPALARSVLTYSPATGFVLLMIAAGAVLTLAPDFGYLKDGFGTRMNTVFKLYYQGWLLWGIASAYAVWSVLFQPGPVAVKGPSTRTTMSKAAFAVVVGLLVMAGLVYPIYGVISRAWVEGGHLNGANTTMSLDGASTLAVGADDYATIQCLAAKATSDHDVVLEATKHGLAYTPQWGRVSALTGIPTLLGWDNHENQWRGDTFTEAASSDINGNPAENRIDVAARIYNSLTWADVSKLITQYGITYIYVGPTERSNFPADGLSKFDSLTPVCSSGIDANGKPAAAVYAVASIGALTPEKTGG